MPSGDVCVESIFTSSAISVDRLLTLLLGLRYRHVVTLRRVRVVIFCFWFINVSLGSIRISRRDIALKAVSTVLPLSLVISIFCYTRIFFRLRHQQVQVPQGQANEGEIPVNMARYKTLVSSILWVQLALVACYAPWGIAVVLYVNGIGNDDAWLVSDTLIYLNSSVNPADPVLLEHQSSETGSERHNGTVVLLNNKLDRHKSITILFFFFR